MKKLFNKQTNMHTLNKKQGIYSLAMALLVISIIIIVNLMAKQLNISIDLTEDGVFSLSKQSLQIIKELNDEVEIIALHKSGSDESTITRILDEYKKNSQEISVTYVDPELHPNIVTEYQQLGSTLSYGSVIVSTGYKYKTITAEEMYTYDKDFKKIETVQAESKITNSILYVVNDYDSVVYTMVGHDEEALPNSIKKVLETENYKIQDLQLIKGGGELTDNDVVILNGPKKDITKDELESLLQFLHEGGNLFLFLDLIDQIHPNIDELINSYGVNVNKAMIFENDKNHTVTSQNFYLLPKLTDHHIVDPLQLAKSSVISVYAQPIETMNVKKDTLIIESLATTSKDSYGKSIEKMKNTSTQEKEADDLEGPFDIAVAITDVRDKANEQLNGKMVLFSSSYVLKEQLIEASNEANIDVVINSINWLSDRQDSISIRGKDVSSKILKMNQSEQMIVSILVMGIIPLLIIMIGGVTWYRRLNK